MHIQVQKYPPPTELPAAPLLLSSNGSGPPTNGSGLPIDEIIAELVPPDRTLLVPYVVTLCVLGAGCLLMLVYDQMRTVEQQKPSRGKSASGWDPRYLLPYAMCAAADWLQGPYVYALYDDYGYERHTIMTLFVAGFTAAMVTGPIVGGLADRFGLRLMILTGYCLVYALACVTKRRSRRAGALAPRRASRWQGKHLHDDAARGLLSIMMTSIVLLRQSLLACLVPVGACRAGDESVLSWGRWR